MYESSETTPESRAELIRSAASKALSHVMGPVEQATTAASIQEAYTRRGIIPEGIDGDIAIQVAAGLQRGQRLTEEQTKWFALGVAAQANASTELRELGVQE